MIPKHLHAAIHAKMRRAGGHRGEEVAQAVRTDEGHSHVGIDEDVDEIDATLVGCSR